MPVYDVADMLKLYFHELPDCLLTERLSETCCSVFARKKFMILFDFLIKTSNRPHGFVNGFLSAPHCS